MSGARTYPVTPVTKPRQTRRDKWEERPSVMVYRAFADEVRLRRIHVPEEGAVITFVLPMPASWSEKKKQSMDGQPHCQTPDIDNLLKALLDAVHKNDSHIHHIAGLTKKWGREGSITIEY